MGNLPGVYDIEIHSLRKRLDDLDNPLTIEEVREELNLKYEMMNRRFRGDPSGDNEETELFAGSFKGKCNSCGKFGHRARNCRSKVSTSNSLQSSGNHAGNLNGTANDKDKDIDCFYCKRKGHQIADCLKLKRKEQSNVGLDSGKGSTESTIKLDDEKSSVGLGMIDGLPNDYAVSKMDSDFSNIFIADIGASCHMIGSLEGMTDLIDINESITVGNVQKIKVLKIGTMKGTVTLPDRTIRKVSLHNCKYVPQLAPFNLFSITHALSRGFNLGNEKEKILIEKDDFKTDV